MINYIEKKEVTVVDATMGMGKTSWAIQMINNSPLTHKFIVVTPYLEEIERIIKATEHKRNFIEPDIRNSKGTKFYSLKQLLEKGSDIVTTHALFKEADKEILDLLTLHHYILIMDEVADVIEKLNITKDDIEHSLMPKLIEVDANGKVIWKVKDYDGEFKSLKLMVETEKVFLHNGTAFIWEFPIEVFKKFRKVYILTYMFKAQIQRYFFDIHGLEYNMKSIEVVEPSTTGYTKEYKLVDYRKPDDVTRFKNLIHICEDEKLNDIGESTSTQGYDNLTFSKLTKLKKSSPIIKTIKNNLYTFFRHRCKATSQQVMWACPKDVRKNINPQGYLKGFIPSNKRATNEFMDRNVCAYILNKFMNPSIVGFFESYDVTVDQDLYALSELVQWLFRSAIRNDEPIELYIPSNRMRTLLKMWLDGQL
ncbi:MAG: hypothetical protein ACERLG_00710 [Sedimentibacter sp.]